MVNAQACALQMVKDAHLIDTHGQRLGQTVADEGGCWNADRIVRGE